MTKCDICNLEYNKLLYRINNTNIVRCKVCQLVYVDKNSIKKDFLNIYNENYYKNKNVKIMASPDPSNYFGYSDYLGEKDGTTKNFKRYLIEIEKYKANGNILDIGCGPGFFLETAKKRGWNTTGIEVSEFAADFARKNGLNVLSGNLKKFRFNDQFDVITLFDVIEHFYNPLSELKEIYRVLKPGGLLVIVTPDVNSLVAKLLKDRWEEFRRVKEHLYFFSKETIDLMLYKAGFKVIKRGTAGKYFTIVSFIQRLGLDDNKAKILDTLLAKVKLNKLKFYINPLSKMVVYAVKYEK